jgi:hypothetical protein
MPSPTYTLFRNAILAERQVICTYDGSHRELCPHIIGINKDGEEVVLAWQFAGESSGKLPQWRCLKLAKVGAHTYATDDGMKAAPTAGSRPALQVSISTSTFTCAGCVNPNRSRGQWANHLPATRPWNGYSSIVASTNPAGSSQNSRMIL